MLAEWIDTFANVAPTIAAPATATVTENAPVGGVVATVAANDPDMRAGQPDNNFLSYSITAGNPNNLFTINPTTGQISINGILDYEMSTQHALQITVADNFAANPKSAVHNLAVNLQNVANEDANGNGIPDWWESSFTANLASGGDADGDGVRDFFEFLAGSDPEHPDTGASLNLRVVAYVPGPTPGYVTWRARNGLFLNQHYSRAPPPRPAHGPASPANYQVVSVRPSRPAFPVASRPASVPRSSAERRPVAAEVTRLHLPAQRVSLTSAATRGHSHRLPHAAPWRDDKSFIIRNLELASGLALVGIVVNATLAAVKITAGLIGNTYVLIADGIESLLDIFGSLVIWFGLRVAAEPPDDEHPYGHGKAEPMAAVVVALGVMGAALALAVQSVREIVTPHHAPAPFTLVVLVVVVIVKETLFRKVIHTGNSIGSAAVKTDAWHHRSDAITSIAVLASRSRSSAVPAGTGGHWPRCSRAVHRLQWLASLVPRCKRPWIPRPRRVAGRRAAHRRRGRGVADVETLHPQDGARILRRYPHRRMPRSRCAPGHRSATMKDDRVRRSACSSHRPSNPLSSPQAGR